MSVSDEAKFYLAGPMSGIPQHNFPVFIAAAKHLRQLGYTIISPAELDDPQTYAAAMASPDGSPTGQQSWGDFLSRDVKFIADDVDGIIFLPEWAKSRGARLEAFVALLSNKEQFGVYYASALTDPVRWVSKDWLRGVLTMHMP